MLSALALPHGSFLCPFVSLISSIVYYPWVRAPGTELKYNRSAEVECWKILRVSQAPEGSPGQPSGPRGESPPVRVRPAKRKFARVVPDALSSGQGCRDEWPQEEGTRGREIPLRSGTRGVT